MASSFDFPHEQRAARRAYRQKWDRTRNVEGRPKAWNETPEFLALFEKWNKKLLEVSKTDGMGKDIEMFRRVDGEAFERMNGIREGDILATWSPGQQRYFEMARQWLWVLREPGGTSKLRPKSTPKCWIRMWELYSEGKGIDKIQATMQREGYGRGRWRIWFQLRLRRLRAAFAEWRSAESDLDREEAHLRADAEAAEMGVSPATLAAMRGEADE